MWSLTTPPRGLQTDLFQCRDITQKTRDATICYIAFDNDAKHLWVECIMSVLHTCSSSTQPKCCFIDLCQNGGLHSTTQRASLRHQHQSINHMWLFLTGESASHDWKTTNRATLHHSLVITPKSKWGGCNASNWVISYMGANLVLHYTDLIDLSCSTVVHLLKSLLCN